MLTHVQEEWTKLNHTCAKMIQVPIGKTGVEAGFIAEINHQFKLGNFRNAFLGQLKEAGIIESVEAYGGSDVAPKGDSSAAKSNSTTAADDDNIELF